MVRENTVRNGSGIAVLLFSAVNLFVCIVPGSALLLLGAERGEILPVSIVESIYPFAILPFEKLFVVDVLSPLLLGSVTLAEFDHVSVYFQQFFVLAFVFFLLVFLFVGIQMGAGALYLEKGEASAPQVAVTLLILLVMRSFWILLMLMNVDGVPKDRSVAKLAILPALAPEFLILTTCFLAGVICAALRLAYRRIASS
jgi:hypothetical protein